MITCKKEDQGNFLMNITDECRVCILSEVEMLL